jgi:hypothetical protein
MTGGGEPGPHPDGAIPDDLDAYVAEALAGPAFARAWQRAGLSWWRRAALRLTRRARSPWE